MKSRRLTQNLDSETLTGLGDIWNTVQKLGKRLGAQLAQQRNAAGTSAGAPSQPRRGGKPAQTAEAGDFSFYFYCLS